MSLFRLLDQISRILFEPFFIFMIVGFFLVILLNWRRRDRFFYFFLVAFGVMLTWRYVVNLVSKRYSEILIYAGICMTAYFLALFPSWISCRFHPFLQRHFRRMDQMLHQYPRLVSRVLILILVLICFAKLSRFNRFDDTIPQSCTVVKTDAKMFKKTMILDACEEFPRLKYYSGMPILSLRQEARETRLKKIAVLLKRPCDAFYVFLKEKPGEQTAAASIGAAENEWTLIFSEWRDNRRKLLINVYRYRRLSRDEKQTPQ